MQDEAPIAPEKPPRLVITQDNQQRMCFIREANPEAVQLFAASNGLVDAPITEIFGTRVLEEIADLLEYEVDAPDLLDILEKQRDVKFRLNTGEEMVLPMRLTRILSRDANVWFALEIPSERTQRAGQQLRDLLRMNLESRLVLDESTGLPNRETCFGFFDSVHQLIATQGQTAAIVALRMDRYEKSLARYGKIGCTQLMQHLAGSCRRMVSDEDVVCQLNDQTLALFLMNFSRESARVMLNRLRWLLRSHRIDFGGKSEFSVTVSIAFDIIHGNAGEGALQRCEDAVMALDAEARNQLLEPAV